MGRFFGRRRRDRKVGPQRVVDQPLVTGIGLSAAAEFRMIVQDVFRITGRGVLVGGKIEAGIVAAGSSVAIERDGRQVGTSEVIGIERFRKVVTEAEAGEEVGLLLRELRREHVAAGDILRSTW
jgi:translation elongation factor EF-Tu-like GTPase